MVLATPNTFRVSCEHGHRQCKMQYGIQIMEFRLRNIPDHRWKQFKILCLEEDTTLTKKLLDLIQKELVKKGKLE